jgi:hypothetical protein
MMFYFKNKNKTKKYNIDGLFRNLTQVHFDISIISWRPVSLLGQN